MIKKACCGLAATLLLLSGLSCNRYLDVKPDRKSFVPETLDDLEALLNNRMLMNSGTPPIIEALSDNYYTTVENFRSWPQEAERKLYVWDAEVQTLSAWQQIYQGPVYLSNVVLDLLAGIRAKSGDTGRADRLEGMALFHRANGFFLVAQYYCMPYSPANGSEPGIPIRTTAAIAEPVVRHTVEETYHRIVSDLKAAADLLPENTTLLTEPSRKAAFALLARVYLTMGRYEDAWAYADRCVREGIELIDFNGLQPDKPAFARFNTETLFYNDCRVTYPFLNTPNRGRVDSTLLRSYHEHDLRKRHFFTPVAMENPDVAYLNCFEGDFNSQITFNGPMASEVLLIRAECSARKGDIAMALEDLNRLLESRWDAGKTFTPVVAADAQQALDKVLLERRKELVNRGLRWSDARRLNAEGYQITFRRILGDDVYALPPGDARWTLLIPDEVIAASGLPQNSR